MIMDGVGTLTLLVFLAGAFVGAFVAGLAGFALGLVAAAIWLHVLPPAETVTLVVAYALLVQGYAVWRLRRSVVVARVVPFVIGSAVGIPGGIFVLRWLSPAHLRVGVGALLVAFSLYSLARPRLPHFTSAGPGADGAVGVLNGALAGATGLGGILPTIWSSMRGWSRDEQRAVFQPTAVATFIMTLAWLGGLGVATHRAASLFVAGLPALAMGTWLGWKLYGRLDEASFRKVVLVLLLASGLVLALTAR